MQKCRRKFNPSTRTVVTSPRSSGPRTMRYGRTAIPRPQITPLTRAVVLMASQTGWMLSPAASTMRSNSSRVPLPRSRRMRLYYATIRQRCRLRLFRGGAGLEVTMTSRLVMLTACGCLRNSTTK